MTSTNGKTLLKKCPGEYHDNSQQKRFQILEGANISPPQKRR
jgi:hypothetical protein